jgi:OmpA-OmpF porin, OOP family
MGNDMPKSALAALFLLATLTACEGTQANHAIEQLRSVAETGDTYQTLLATGYRDYAEERRSANDAVAARYFAEKGLLAARGRDIKPEYPSQMALSAETFEDLVATRDKLVPAIAASRSTQPETAATAMIAYDRWVMLEEQKTNLPAAEEARQVVMSLLATLSEAHTATVTDIPTTTIPATAAATDVAKSKSGVLYFPLDSDRLGQSAKGALGTLVREVKGHAHRSISVNGHADRLGSEDYNMDLSERRARFVVDALRNAGVPASMLHYFAYGESDPAVPTPDEVGEPKNRRVEVFVE